MNLSPIEWTDYTSNPLRYLDPEGNIVHACVHASEGCRLCYSEKLAPRWGRKGMPFTAENMKRLTPFLDQKELQQILSLKKASGKKCFLGDMTDIFGEWVPDELLDRLFAVMALRSDVTFQILTKRADRMRKYFIERETQAEVWYQMADKHGWLSREDAMTIAVPEGTIFPTDPAWPLPNVWLGVSAENQEWADKRIPLLLETPAAVRFVSYEPALGPVDFDMPRCDSHDRDEVFFDEELKCECCVDCRANGGSGELSYGHWLDPLNGGLNWIIVGGESGPGARPFNINWARSIVRQCKAAGVACFVKQVGAKPYACRESDKGLPDHQSCIAEGCEDMKSRKGGDPEEWAEDLRVREWPR